MRRVGRITRLVVFVALVLVVAPAAAAFKYVEVGQEAPGFSLRGLDGATVSLAETVAGNKATALVFWATWSPRSKPLLDDLEALYRAHRETGLRVVAVAVDHEEFTAENRDQIASLAASWGFPVLLDQDLTTYYAYGVVATPTLALLDDSGVVRYVRASYSSSAKLEIEEQVMGMLGLAPEVEGRAQVSKRSYVPPKKATLHYQKAQVLIRRGRARRAVRDLEKATRLDPQWAEPRVLLARIYLGEAARKPGALEKAEALLAEAETLQPEHLQTLSLRAQVLTRLGRYEEALAAAERALALEPAFTPALLAKANCLRGQGRLEEAGAAVQEALALAPRNPEVLAELGEVEAAAGRWQEAATALRSAAEAALGAAEREK